MANKVKLYIALVIIAIIWIIFFRTLKCSDRYSQNKSFSNKSYADKDIKLLEESQYRTNYLSKSADMIYEFYLYESKVFDLVGENIISGKLYNHLRIASDLEVIIDGEEKLLRNFKKLHPPLDYVAEHRISCESYETKIDNIKSLAIALRLKKPGKFL